MSDLTKKTEFKPGDKFILELGEERKMFGEFEIAGTDLYVKVDLLEKLTRYEPEINTDENNHYNHYKTGYTQGFVDAFKIHEKKQPEIIHCKDCTHGKSDVFDRGMWCELHPLLDVTKNDYCSRAER